MLSCQSKTHIVKQLAEKYGVAVLVQSLNKFEKSNDSIFNTDNIQSFPENEQQNVMAARKLFDLYNYVESLSPYEIREIATRTIDDAFKFPYMQFESFNSLRDDFLNKIDSMNLISKNTYVSTENYGNKILDFISPQKTTRWFEYLSIKGVVIDPYLLHASVDDTENTINAKLRALGNQIETPLTTDALLDLFHSFKNSKIQRIDEYKTILYGYITNGNITDLNLKNKLRLLEITEIPEIFSPHTFFTLDDLKTLTWTKEKRENIFTSQFLKKENCVSKNIPHQGVLSTQTLSSLVSNYAYQNILTHEDFKKMGFSSPYDERIFRNSLQSMLLVNLQSHPDGVVEIMKRENLDKLYSNEPEYAHAMIKKGGKKFYDCINKSSGHHNCQAFLSKKDKKGHTVRELYVALTKREKLMTELKKLTEITGDYKD